MLFEQLKNRCKLGYSLRVSVRNIETIKDTGMYMAPNIQLFELDIDKESNIGKFFKGSDLVIGAIGPSADYSEKMLLSKCINGTEK